MKLVWFRPPLESVVVVAFGIASQNASGTLNFNLTAFFNSDLSQSFLRLSAFPSDYNTNMQGFLPENKDKKRLLLSFFG